MATTFIKRHGFADFQFFVGAGLACVINFGATGAWPWPYCRRASAANHHHGQVKLTTYTYKDMPYMHTQTYYISTYILCSCAFPYFTTRNVVGGFLICTVGMYVITLCICTNLHNNLFTIYRINITPCEPGEIPNHVSQAHRCRSEFGSHRLTLNHSFPAVHDPRQRLTKLST